jgi:membrane fusion protein (multidrug efflux system)
VAVVQPRAFQDTIEVLGVAKGRQSVTLTAAATQLVDRVRFRDGQHVAKGAILVELKDTEQDAGTAQAQARLAVAKSAYVRYKTLGDQGWAAKSIVDQYESVYRAAQADVEAAKARQNDRIIRAPFAGVVGLSDVAPGALVNPGAPIVTLDDVLCGRVDFQVPERYPGATAARPDPAGHRRRLPGRDDQPAASRSWTAGSTERTRAITGAGGIPQQPAAS